MTTVPLRRNRNYTLLWAGQAVSEVGFSTTMIAFPLLVLAITGSPAASGLVLGADAAAQLLAGLPAGALVDRWDRKRIMLWCEAAMAAAVGSLALALWWDSASLAHMVLVAVIMGVCRALFEPAEDACLTRLVPEEQLATAISLNAARSSIGQMAGTALGGVLFAIGRVVPFLVDMITHLISLISLAFLRVPYREVERAPIGNIGKEIAEGLRWVWSHRHVRVTALCAVSLNFFFNAFYIVIIVLANARGVPAGQIGLMAAMLGFGGLLGSLLAPTLHRILHPWVSIMAVFWMVTLLTPLTILAPNGYVLGALFAGMSFLAPTANTTINTHQLLLTPDDLRGRLSGVMNVVVGAAAAAGPAAGGVLVEFVDGTVAVLWCTAGMAAVSLLVTVSPVLRRFPVSV
ncbi:MFS transporter [Kibdelosporangium aridum]|uniref:Predicted arabinose efflux permease, MFS family n=1 Tax=Kibdelosporangium aridum TaxID=2030 RepID=A0A1Y5Y8E0_KIBAR|nr:MFS transporter [Kibdelosporangium aridum]SMD26150.1 Predicted arabinose efflux permease, MFS family [Kibdelosporangium aridum]